MITNALRSLWAEPRAADAPARGWRDWVLVGVVVVTALLEGVFRDDVAWRPFATIVANGRHVTSSRRTPSSSAVTITTPTSTQSRYPRGGTSVTGGSAHSYRRAWVITHPA